MLSTVFAYQIILAKKNKYEIETTEGSYIVGLQIGQCMLLIEKQSLWERTTEKN